MLENNCYLQVAGTLLTFRFKNCSIIPLTKKSFTVALFILPLFHSWRQNTLFIHLSLFLLTLFLLPFHSLPASPLLPAQSLVCCHGSMVVIRGVDLFVSYYSILDSKGFHIQESILDRVHRFSNSRISCYSCLLCFNKAEWQRFGNEQSV